MKKLGFKEFFIWGAVILLFLIIAIFYIIRLSSNWPTKDTPKDTNTQKETDNNDNSDGKVSYKDLELSLQNAAIDYISYNYPEGMDTGSKTVYAKSLVEAELLENFVDSEDGTECTGYAIVLTNENFELNSMPYIKCSNYKTEGFSEYR